MKALALAVLAFSCSGGATPDLGYGNDLVVQGAQFRPGNFPDASGGPATLNLSQKHTGIVIGEVREPISALFDGTATGVIVGIQGEPGNWTLPTQPPDIENPDDSTLTATIGLSLDAQQGAFTLVVAAVDSDGKIGEPASLSYIALATPSPSGDLVVSLVWNSTADLDLHVIDGSGNEVWSGKPSTWTAPPAGGDPVDPNVERDEVLASGWLDEDANANCTFDGAPAEHVIWTPRTDPITMMTIEPVIPSGTYTVRVDTRSLCKDASAYWYVEADSEGSDIGAARGIATPDDTLAPHGAGAGITALTFDLP
ncbi:MAG TPA: hypothetical protein VH143_03655 [Kofleriaceae bacterium]|nr:hypothetical protein [Kofleriaceae bacterium]